jgi:hypothetical protein
LNYRAYIIGSNGEFHEAIALECLDDNAATMKAKQFVDAHHVELWQCHRKIATFEPNTDRLQKMFRA